MRAAPAGVDAKGRHAGRQVRGERDAIPGRCVGVGGAPRARAAVPSWQETYVLQRPAATARVQRGLPGRDGCPVTAFGAAEQLNEALSAFSSLQDEARKWVAGGAQAPLAARACSAAPHSAVATALGPLRAGRGCPVVHPAVVVPRVLRCLRAGRKDLQLELYKWLGHTNTKLGKFGAAADAFRAGMVAAKVGRRPVHASSPLVHCGGRDAETQTTRLQRPRTAHSSCLAVRSPRRRGMRPPRWRTRSGWATCGRWRGSWRRCAKAGGLRWECVVGSKRPSPARRRSELTPHL
jgi:hypothetical protein